jgi:sugar phosphate isomerase/epimerase
MNRRSFLASLSAALARVAAQLPADRNVKWALSAALWSHFPPCPFTEILDVMKDTGFIGIRLAGFPRVLETYGVSAAQMEKEVSKRNLHVVTISFGGPLHDPLERGRVLDDARAAMRFLVRFGSDHLVVFSPGRSQVRADPDVAFRELCARCNQIGELAGEMGFTAGLHNHLNEMVESPQEVHRFMSLIDPKLFGLSPDTAHLHLAGGNVVEILEKYKTGLRFLDYKDARCTMPTVDWVEPSGKLYPKDSKEARFLASIYDLGDGEIDFPSCHRILKSVNFRGWICVDLDSARQGPRVSYARCATYVTTKLEPIYR